MHLSRLTLIKTRINADYEQGDAYVGSHAGWGL